MNESTSRLSSVGLTSGMMMCHSFSPQPQLSSSAASITSEGSECSAASSTTMLKPAHIQVVTKMSEGSAIRGSPIQACTKFSKRKKRRSALTAPQSPLYIQTQTMTTTTYDMSTGVNQAMRKSRMPGIFAYRASASSSAIDTSASGEMHAQVKVCLTARQKISSCMSAA